MSSLFWHFLRHPFQVGACCASSPDLCDKITSDIGIGKAEMVAELGPGTGAITEVIRQKISSSARFAAVELDPQFAAGIRKKYPEILLFQGCASQLDTMLESQNLPHPEIIISGLPFAIFPDELQEKILTGAVRALSPGGVFCTFAYIQGTVLPAGIRFRRKLEKHFAQVEITPVIWKNIPPAIIYRCRTAAAEKKEAI